jgi:hypothetical protein
MRRTISAAVLLLAVTATTTGCGFFKKSDLSELVEYHFQVTGVAADKITYALQQRDEHHNMRTIAEEKANPTLPWTQAGVADPGMITLTVTPKDGPATCRIVVEKKELAKKTGQPGAPLSCSAKIKG